ncbi:MAG: hypothetical protein DSY89_09260 [Deltaproteobacteria bacterium]|nr:MAG: hypothetical protein DSY89_09260 [Deltaproteobacteria bacterium]
MTKRLFLICGLLFWVLLPNPAQANESLGSEMSHVLGGAVMAGGITAVIDRYFPQHAGNRKMIGFWASSIAIIVEQGVEVVQHGNTMGQLLDAASHILGSAIGAYVTDKYILSPIIDDSRSMGKCIGLNIQYNF